MLRKLGPILVQSLEIESNKLLTVFQVQNTILLSESRGFVLLCPFIELALNIVM